MCQSIGGGSVGYKGQILNIEQDISSITTKLPLMINDIPCFIVCKPNKHPNGYCDLKINKDNIMIWLKHLKTIIPFMLILIFVMIIHVST